MDQKRTRRTRKTSLVTVSILVLASMTALPGMVPSVLGIEPPDCVPTEEGKPFFEDTPAEGTEVCLYLVDPLPVTVVPGPNFGDPILFPHDATLEMAGPAGLNANEPITAVSSNGLDSCSPLSSIPFVTCTLGAQNGDPVRLVEDDEPLRSLCLWGVEGSWSTPTGGGGNFGPIDEAVLFPC